MKVLLTTIFSFFLVQCGKPVISSLSGFDGLDSAVYWQEKPRPLQRVAVISDLNGSYGSLDYDDNVKIAVDVLSKQIQPDLVLITGDMVAGQKQGLDYQGMWKAFQRDVARPLAVAGIPVAPSPGNHDASAYAAFSAERAVYASHWETFKPELNFIDHSRFPLRYSFRHGQTLFIAIDATIIGPMSSEQRGWIKDQLESATWANQKIVYGHMPIHPVSQRREREVMSDFSFEAILAENDGIFVSGHHHAYYPGKAGGVRQIGMPCLGSGPRKYIGTDLQSEIGILVIDLDRDRISSLEAYRSPFFQSIIDRRSLPREITFEGHRLQRDDL